MKKLFIILLLVPYISIANSNNSLALSQEVIDSLSISESMRHHFRSGDIVGNGGGLFEQSFRYVYKVLPLLIHQCTDLQQCPLSASDKVMLNRIAELAKKNSTHKDGLVFFNPLNFPDFFFDENDPEERIAKTAPIQGAPIFINLKLVYENERNFEKIPAIASILIHELGHQLGIKSHSYLDDLASRFKRAINANFKESIIEIDNDKLSVQAYNPYYLSKETELVLSYKRKLFPLGERVRSKLSCKHNNGYFLGYQLTNLHWQRRVKSQSKSTLIPFSAWLSYSCIDEDNMIWTFEKDLIIKIEVAPNKQIKTNISVR